MQERLLPELALDFEELLNLHVRSVSALSAGEDAICKVRKFHDNADDDNGYDGYDSF